MIPNSIKTIKSYEFDVIKGCHWAYNLKTPWNLLE